MNAKPLLLIGAAAGLAWWMTREKAAKPFVMVGPPVPTDAERAAYASDGIDPNFVGPAVPPERQPGLFEAIMGTIVEPIKQLVSGPRGIRNNNPGNIDRVKGTTWAGAAADQSGDPRFVVFTAPEYGIRAMARILRTYRGRGLNTIQKIISTWAPSKENPTAGYITAVSGEVGLAPNVVVPDAAIPRLIAAIIRHENGIQPYPAALIAKGIAMERGQG